MLVVTHDEAEVGEVATFEIDGFDHLQVYVRWPDKHERREMTDFDGNWCNGYQPFDPATGHGVIELELGPPWPALGEAETRTAIVEITNRRTAPPNRFLAQHLARLVARHVNHKIAEGSAQLPKEQP